MLLLDLLADPHLMHWAYHSKGALAGTCSQCLTHFFVTLLAQADCGVQPHLLPRDGDQADKRHVCWGSGQLRTAGGLGEWGLGRSQGALVLHPHLSLRAQAPPWLFTASHCLLTRKVAGQLELPTQSAIVVNK